MSDHPVRRPHRSLLPLIAVTVAATLFAILLVMVRLRWLRPRVRPAAPLPR